MCIRLYNLYIDGKPNPARGFCGSNPPNEGDERDGGGGGGGGVEDVEPAGVLCAASATVGADFGGKVEGCDTKFGGTGNRLKLKLLINCEQGVTGLLQIKKANKFRNNVIR